LSFTIRALALGGSPMLPDEAPSPTTFDRRSASMSPLGYLTTDPVNAAMAEALAAQHGVDLLVVEPRDLPRLVSERIDLVVDWDFIPEDYRAELLNGTTLNIVGIHGYGLSGSLASFLPRRGILCSPRLDQQFLQGLTGRDNAA
jgi:hypothetical protein